MAELKRHFETTIYEIERKLKEQETKNMENSDLNKINGEQKSKIENREYKVKESKAILEDKDCGENTKPKDDETNYKSKPKNTKRTKGKIEEKLITAHERDAEGMFSDFKRSGLDDYTKKCKKCKLKIHSEGLLKRHKMRVHDSGISKENIFLGFELDMPRYCKQLESMKVGIERFKCEEHEYKIYREGKLTMHKLTTHQV